MHRGREGQAQVVIESGVTGAEATHQRFGSGLLLLHVATARLRCTVAQAQRVVEPLVGEYEYGGVAQLVAAPDVQRVALGAEAPFHGLAFKHRVLHGQQGAHHDAAPALELGFKHALRTAVGRRDMELRHAAAVHTVGSGIAERVPSHCLVVAHTQVAVLVNQGHQAVGSLGDIMESKVALLVGACHQVGQRVVAAVTHHGQHLVPGLAVARIEHTAGQHQGVHSVAGAEDILITRQHIALGEVGNGLLELEEVGGVLAQRVAQLHHHTHAAGTVFGLLLHGRRDQHIVVGVLEHHIFVKLNEELPRLEVARLVLWLAGHSLGRLRVLGAARRVALLGATRNRQ